MIEQDSRNSSKDANLKGLLAVRSEHKIRQENLAFDIDVWYPLIKVK